MFWQYRAHRLSQTMPGFSQIGARFCCYLGCCRLIHLMWMWLTRTSVTSSRKHPKRLSHVCMETTIFRAGMRSVNLSIKLFCSLLRETTQVWLLQFCFPSLTGSREIDGSRQFGASTFHILVEKHGVFLTTLLVGRDTPLVTVLSQLMLLHLS